MAAKKVSEPRSEMLREHRAMKLLSKSQKARLSKGRGSSKGRSR